jgi:hypothetical protein
MIPDIEDDETSDHLGNWDRSAFDGDKMILLPPQRSTQQCRPGGSSTAIAWVALAAALALLVAFIAGPGSWP